MSGLRILEPVAIASIGATRGAGANNLLAPSPREVWSDNAVGWAHFDIDLGELKSFDTLFLGFVTASADALWTANGGVAGHADSGDIIVGYQPLRTAAINGSDPYPVLSHALYVGPEITRRYIRLFVNQVAGAPLTAGVLMVGRSWTHPFAFGGGRQLIDTSRRTDLIDGGFGIEDGVSKAAYRWRFTDLSDAEVEELWNLAYPVGQRRSVVVIEDADASPPSWNQIHYGLFDKFEAYERNNPNDTTWGMSLTEWR